MKVINMNTATRADKTAPKVGRTALHSAAMKGSLDGIRMLLKLGFDVHARTEDEETALHLACDRASLDAVEVLLDWGADAHATTRSNRTTLHYAATGCSLDVAEMLLQRGVDVHARTKDDETALHFACVQAYPEMVELLLDWGADVNATTKWRWTALHYAIFQGGHEILEILLQRGANVQAPIGARMSSPLHYASEKGHGDSVKLLLEHGADIDARDGEGGTALHVAMRNRRVKVAEVLLDHHGAGAVHARDNLDQTPLHIAARCIAPEHVVLVRVLIDHGAHVNACDTHGNTPLHDAAGAGDARVVTELLRAGADLRVLNNQGKTALGRAMLYHREVAKLLLAHGAQRAVLPSPG